MISQKIILYLFHMITESQFINLYNSNYDLKDKFQSIIDRVIKTVDYTKTKTYKYEYFEENECDGVLFYIFDKWIWSWVNTINTNYSCLFLLIDYINNNFDKKITSMDFRSDRIDSTLDYFNECVEQDKDIIFRPGSEVFKGMFFATQNTWNRGIISVLSTIFTIKKNYNINHINLSYNRGDKSDMTKGVDLIINFGGEDKKTQHKSSRIEFDGNYYYSKSFKYNEATYRNNLDLISIESNKKIYLFRNSKDKISCGYSNGKFFIHKDLIENEMSIENQEITNLLTELNKICFQKKIIFMFERGEDGLNYFEDVDVNGNSAIRFFLNDIHDTNLSTMIQEQLDKLQ